MKKHENPSFLIKMAQKKQKDSSQPVTALKNKAAERTALPRNRLSYSHASGRAQTERTTRQSRTFNGLKYQV
ncbi:hypothetical protein CV632_00795 [Geobacillus thermodenitrificans]|uniref:hypothetical protein n=1 Tax=Geobacillus thermodenitrificans TaxID=33940 RepID=UPI000C287FA4|nr:hypothetical protein [Geobacillus thermodenitrificans]MEC5187542.1 hypothetical protein [Geobacillus thermodenitrificans]MED0662382.1 hypothetical protein [Geobacillus thermodenitrificans]PJW21897.1 hypothetical protein CV632_00795 [Geobacillus thermodenitrificans]